MHSLLIVAIKKKYKQHIPFGFTRWPNINVLGKQKSEKKNQNQNDQRAKVQSPNSKPKKNLALYKLNLKQELNKTKL